MDDRRPDAVAPGTDVGAYRIVKRIGVGGTGVVYEALHRRLDKRVALKTLLDTYRQSEEVRQRFINEGIAASRVRHPHVVDITDVGEVGDLPFLVMELLEGETLGSFARRIGALSPETLANVMIPVAAALSEAHRLGVIHRDLKPDNVFLTRSQLGALHPKVLDFGISKVLDDAGESGLTTDEAFLGTPSYASPEQIENGRSVEAASDQYSFGVVLYELATGQPPFRGFASLYPLLRAISTGDCPPPSIQRSDLAPELESVILRAMAVDPDRRFLSMRELGHALLTFASPATQTLWSPFFEPFDEAATRPSVAPALRGEATDSAGASRGGRRGPALDGVAAASDGDTSRTAKTVLALPARARPGADGSGQRRKAESSAGSSAGSSAKSKTESKPASSELVATPGAAVASLEAQPRSASDATPPRWLGWSAVAALLVLGAGSLYAMRQPPSLAERSQRVESLSAAAVERQPVERSSVPPATSRHAPADAPGAANDGPAPSTAGDAPIAAEAETRAAPAPPGVRAADARPEPTSQPGASAPSAARASNEESSGRPASPPAPPPPRAAPSGEPAGPAPSAGGTRRGATGATDTTDPAAATPPSSGAAPSSPTRLRTNDNLDPWQ